MNARDPNLPLQPDEATALGDYARRRWDEAIVPALTDYIAIPAKSPMFDADWAAHGHIERVVRDAAQFFKTKPAGKIGFGHKALVAGQIGRTKAGNLSAHGGRVAAVVKPGTVIKTDPVKRLHRL